MAKNKVEIKIIKESNGMKAGQVFKVSSYTAQVMVKNGTAELNAAPKKSAAKKPAAKKKVSKKTEE